MNKAKQMFLVVSVMLTFYGLFFDSDLKAQNFSMWNNIRNSAYTQDDSIHIRAEIIQTMGADTRLFYFRENGWQRKGLTHINGETRESVIKADPTQNLFVRYHTMMLNDFFDFSDIFPGGADSLVVMMPGFLTDYPDTPDINLLAKVASDPAGDIGEDLPAYLDITGNYFSISDTHIHTAMTNDDTRFPTGPIMGPYNLYAHLIINPESVIQDTVFYGIVYTNVIGLITPGLYRFSGLAFDGITRIGNVHHSVSENRLFMSCLLEDLTSDPYFGQWPSFSNSLIVIPVTLQIDLSMNFTFADTGTLSIQVFQKHFVEPFINRLPDLSNLRVSHSQGYNSVNIDYYDADGNFPIISRLVFDDEQALDFYPLGFDFTDRVRFAAVFPEKQGQGVVEFSDNGYDIVRKPFFVSVDNEAQEMPSPHISVYPNPFLVSHEDSKLKIILSSQFNKSYRAEVYNIRGSLIKTLDEDAEGKHFVWDGLKENGDIASSGVYFISVQTDQQVYRHKFIVVR